MNRQHLNDLQQALLALMQEPEKQKGWCPKKYADIKRQANNDISIVQNFLLKQRNLANLNY